MRSAGTASSFILVSPRVLCPLTCLLVALGLLPAKAAAQCGALPSLSTTSNDGVLGLISGLTQAVGGARCGEPVLRPELELMGPIELPDHLRQSFRIRLSTEGDRDLGDSLVRSFLGGQEIRRGLWAEGLADALAFGVLSTQLILDATLPFRRASHEDAWWRVLLIDGLAHAVAQGISFGLDRLEDPSEEDLARGCQGDDCQVDPFHPGARATMTFTSASLMCLHGQMNDEGPAPCVAGVAAAALAGTMWAFTDEYAFTDVLTSAGIGVLAGYVLPWMTFYGFGERNPLAPTPHSEGDTGVDAWVTPDFSSHGAGLRLQGTF